MKHLQKAILHVDKDDAYDKTRALYARMVHQPSWDVIILEFQWTCNMFAAIEATRLAMEHR